MENNKMENNGTVNQEQNEGFVRENPNEESVLVKEVKFKVFGKEITRYYKPEDAERIEKRIVKVKKAGKFIGAGLLGLGGVLLYKESKTRGIASMNDLIDTQNDQIHSLVDTLNDKKDRILELEDRIHDLENPEEADETEETPFEGVNVVYKDENTTIGTF